MDEIQATFKATTPMFISGADQSAAQLRMPSIKSAIRFWWRALAWGWYDETLTEIQKRDFELFGSTKGQANVLMKLGDVNLKQNQDDFSRLKGAIYLGYGVMNYTGELTRLPLGRDSTFSVSFNLDRVGNEQRKELLGAIKVFGLLGGLGSKSRKGYGSVTLLSLAMNGDSSWSTPSDWRSYRTTIQQLMPSNLGSKLPDYTAFSQRSEIHGVVDGSDSMTVLNEAGSAMKGYRTYETEDPIFRNDHDWMLAATKAGTVPNHPQRVVFGLPHNYFFSSTKAKVDVSWSNGDRRSSPLFIHIHEFSQGNYGAVGALLPAVFLPSNETIKIKAKGIHQIQQKIDFKIIQNLLSPVYFPKIERLLP